MALEVSKFTGPGRYLCALPSVTGRNEDPEQRSPFSRAIFRHNA